MAKSIIKEIVIILLLCLAIMLVFGIVFYEYVPIGKTIPNEVDYTTPQNVKKELASSSDVDDSQIIMTYEINSDDLTNYRRVQDYVPGKANPFSSYETNAETPTQGNSSTGSSSNNNSNNNNNSNDNNSNNNNSNNDNNSEDTNGGHFFQNTGTK